MDLENPLTLGIDCLLSEENGNRIRLKKWITEIKVEHRNNEYRNRMNIAIDRIVKNKMKKTEIDEIEKNMEIEKTKRK